MQPQHYVICAGRPGSGKTEFLKTLAEDNPNHYYKDFDKRDLTDLRVQDWTHFCGYSETPITDVVDYLFLNTEQIRTFLNQLKTYYNEPGFGHFVTLYVYEDNIEACLRNNSVRPPERSAEKTIRECVYNVDTKALLAEFDNLTVIERPVYQMPDWVYYFRSKGFILERNVTNQSNYKFTYAGTEKRYLRSESWRESGSEAFYVNDYDKEWRSSDPQPAEEFTTLDTLLLMLNPPYKDVFEIKKLVQTQGYNSYDYYTDEYRVYQYIDAEELYNKLKELDLIEPNL